jgi:hypothetical protein
MGNLWACVIGLRAPIIAFFDMLNDVLVKVTGCRQPVARAGFWSIDHVY